MIGAVEIFHNLPFGECRMPVRAVAGGRMMPTDRLVDSRRSSAPLFEASLQKCHGNGILQSECC